MMKIIEILQGGETRRSGTSIKVQSDEVITMDSVVSFIRDARLRYFKVNSIKVTKDHYEFVAREYGYYNHIDTSIDDLRILIGAAVNLVTDEFVITEIGKTDGYC